MSLRLAYIALIAVSVALRLVFAYPQASASDQKAVDRSAKQAEPALGSEAAPMISGRSVALSPNTRANSGTETVERRVHERVGAAGFIRR
ncbi:MAG: hypothetical protein JOZ84_07995 [Methylobacteriaceae bacterium]|nr:hypothetical protein [Methylobacteriaceae bacterium]